MKTNIYCNTLRRTLRRLRTPALSGMGFLLASQSMGQAANSCNLLPNPDFELQNVARPSGLVDNVKGGAISTRDEVSSWRSISISGQADYFATNAPPGTASNPASANQSPWAAPFVPYMNNPALRNGTIGIVTGVNNVQGSPFASQEYITPTMSFPLSAGKYYASFRAYRSSASVTSTRLGLNLSTSSNSTGSGYGIQSPTELTNSTWTRVADQFTVPQSTNWYVTIGNQIPSSAGSVAQALYYIDEVELYKIPTAGPAVACTGSGVLIGEGCHIPGATYAWSPTTDMDAPTDGITAFVHPPSTTTYTLTVTLPNNTATHPSTFSSSVTVTGCICPTPAAPELALYDGDANCAGQVIYIITNYDSSVHYTFNRISNISSGFLDTPDRFRIKSNSTSGTFSVTATGCETSATSEVYQAEFCGFQGRATTAYPNPASESVTMPTGTADAVLLNSQGKAVAKPNKAGKFDVRNLPDGLYNLQMQQNGKRVNQRVEVKH
jgi:hypothetical protein